MRILVTAGPTREFFDSVRYISNPSSGKMGYAIAGEAVRRGHPLVLVAGPVALLDPPGAEVVHVQSAQEMFDEATARFAACEAAIMTAAVCDYRPVRRLPHKLRKRPRVRPIQLVPTQDICAHLGRTKGNRVVVGFAMEDHDHHAHAEAKLRAKKCDAIVLNGLGNVGSDSAEIEILRVDSGWSGPVSGSKKQVACQVLDLIEELWAAST